MMKRSALMTALCVVALLGACTHGSRTVRMSGSLEVPAAEGTVKTSPGDNGNTLMEVVVRHLAPPARVLSGASTFVVWAAPLDESSPQNIGALHVDDELRGTLSTLTSLQSMTVFITAEPNPTAQQPSGTPLLTAHIRPN